MARLKLRKTMTAVNAPKRTTVLLLIFINFLHYSIIGCKCDEMQNVYLLHIKFIIAVLILPVNTVSLRIFTVYFHKSVLPQQILGS